LHGVCFVALLEKRSMNEVLKINLEQLLEPQFGENRIVNFTMLAGGASKEAWALDLETVNQKLELILRRASGGVMNADQISLQEEFQALEAARDAGVTVAKPVAYFADVLGKEAFVSERLRGEAVGRRVVSRPEFASARATLPKQFAKELAKIHGLNPESFGFLPGTRDLNAAEYLIARLRNELDATLESHPVIEFALLWLEQNVPVQSDVVVLHGDFRIGNLMISKTGLVGVLDWEFAHVGDPAEDLAWSLIRAWRFGQDQMHLGGIGEVEPYLNHYNALTNRSINLEQLFYWEVMGNVKWAVGAITQARRHLDGHERSVELAVLGRLSGEMELELLHLLRDKI
jgi:aminoglycoside phosphotransferase (APT) family kinase protein